ncbi:MAG TPA: ChbG/HpnK family deacetylase [Abditibacteriaceae bacterium]|jgi:hypothetical protein
MNTRIQLVTRGDDAGSCSSANSAVAQACDSGTLRNVSVMAPGPAFESAVKLFAGRDDVCFGLHITLNAEWDEVKWGPVLPPEQVPSLVDENGYFWPSPQVLHQRGFSADEAMAEIEAQLRRARAADLQVSYIDEHMGVSWIGGLRERIRVFAQREGLVDAVSVQGLPPVQTASTNLVERWQAQLQNVEPGAYVLVTHPGRDEADMRQMFMQGVPPGAIARERDAERQALCDPAFKQICRDNAVQLVRYTDVVPAS